MAVRQQMETMAVVAASLLWSLAPVHPQTCDEPHYRWSEKTDESLASLMPQRVLITTILTTWDTLPLAGGASYRCAARRGKELQVYWTRAWVRTLHKNEEDGDWHVELTARENTPVDSCVVAEIPPTHPDETFGRARAELDTLLASSAVRSDGRVDPPVRLRVIGAAFFDGEHRGSDHRKTDGHHGHCNSSARALWELHPVYWVMPAQ
jgi:hypothetical protein